MCWGLRVALTSDNPLPEWLHCAEFIPSTIASIGDDLRPDHRRESVRVFRSCRRERC